MRQNWAVANEADKTAARAAKGIECILSMRRCVAGSAAKENREWVQVLSEGGTSLVEHRASRGIRTNVGERMDAEY